MSDLFEVINEVDGIIVDDELYFLSYDTDIKAWYRNRFDFTIIKGNKILIIPGNTHEFQNKVFRSKKSSVPGLYPYCKEVNDACTNKLSTIIECIASDLTYLPVKFIPTTSIKNYVDLYDEPITVYDENFKNKTPYRIIGDYVTAFVMVYDDTSDKKYIRNEDMSKYTDDLDWWCEGDIDEFEYYKYYIGHECDGMVWVESDLPSDVLPNITPTSKMRPSEYLSSMINELCYINPYMYYEHINICKCVEGIFKYLILEYPILYGTNITNTTELELNDLLERYDGFIVESNIVTDSDDIYKNIYSELFSKDEPTVFDFHRQFKHLRVHLKELKKLLEKTVDPEQCMIHGRYCSLRSAIMTLRDMLKDFNKVVSYIEQDDIY